MKRILYFLEDRAQERFVTGLVRRVAIELRVDVRHDIRSAAGGVPRVIDELKSFVQYLPRSSRASDRFDILIVGIDADCRTRAQRSGEIDRVLSGTGVETRAVYCLPDPYIERWYITDTQALRRALGRNPGLVVPQRKCEKSLYKGLLAGAVRQVGSLLGGAEYGDQVAQYLDYDLLAREDDSFRRFVEDLRRHLAR